MSWEANRGMSTKVKISILQGYSAYFGENKLQKEEQKYYNLLGGYHNNRDRRVEV